MFVLYFSFIPNHSMFSSHHPNYSTCHIQNVLFSFLFVFFHWQDAHMAQRLCLNAVGKEPLSAKDTKHCD